MYPMVEEWLKSGTSKAVFCKNRQVNTHTFTYWLGKYRKEKNIKAEKQDAKISKHRKSFVALQVDVPPMSSGFQLELSYPNGVYLRLAHQPCVDDLTALVQISKMSNL